MSVINLKDSGFDDVLHVTVDYSSLQLFFRACIWKKKVCSKHL